MLFKVIPRVILLKKEPLSLPIITLFFLQNISISIDGNHDVMMSNPQFCKVVWNIGPM